MRLRMFTFALAVCLTQAPPAEAGLNIGMKLACKRYGDAWKSGSQSALRGVTTGDFGSVWSRVPPEVYARLPRSGSGKVLSSQKGRGRGSVTVATNEGVVTFDLVGGGFNWTVTDIYKAGDDGQTVSLKNYMDASLTAGEFMRDLKNSGGTAFHDSISRQFRESFHQLSATELNRIRQFLPPINNNAKPYLQMRGDYATMRVRIPNGAPDECVTFKLVREQGWRVDDYIIDSHEVQISSFRNALPAIACVSGFGEFVSNPEKHDPARFSVGALRDELVAARTAKPFPLTVPTSRDLFVISPCGRNVSIKYPGKTVRMEIGRNEGCNVITRIETLAGEKWADVGAMLAMQRQVKSLSLGTAFAGLTMRQTATDAAAEPSVLENAASQEPVSEPATVAKKVSEVVDNDVQTVPATVPAAVASYEAVRAYEVAPPVTYQVIQPVRYTSVSPKAHRKMMRQMRRGCRHR